MKYLLLFLFSLALSNCAEQPCDIKKVERIQAIQGGNNGVISYAHEVLLEGFSRSCMDSSFVLNIIAKYRDTSSFQPIGGVEIFKSKSGFDIGETLSQPKSYNRNRLISVHFYNGSLTPTDFYFYKNGKIIYEGDNWLK